MILLSGRRPKPRVGLNTPHPSGFYSDATKTDPSLPICSRLLLGTLPSPLTAKTAAATDNVQTHSIAHLGSHLASYHIYSCYASERVFYLLPPTAEGWTKKQVRLI